MSYGWRPHIESALQIDAAHLHATGLLRPNNFRSGAWRWGDVDDSPKVWYSLTTHETRGTLTLRYDIIDRHSDDWSPVVCVIPLSTTPLHYGGLRWWLHCPATNRRARKLYKFDGIEQFCHRLAIRPEPTYRSQRVSGITRIQEKRWAIRRKLRDVTTSLSWGPLRPKWMRWRTFERYERRDDELAECEDRCFSPCLLRLVRRLGK